MNAYEAAAIEVGQRIVYKGDMANSPGKGAVVAVYDGPAVVSFPTGVRSNVSVDVILEDGREFARVSGANIGGEFADKTCRFMLADGVADDEERAGLIGAAVIRNANLKAKGEEVARIFAAAKEAAKAQGKAIGLVPEAEFKGRGRAAAFNMRAELKAAGIKAGVKCRVYSGGSSIITVDLVDDADLAKAKAITGKYVAGRFDGMTDCYEYDPCAWGEVFGDVSFVFVNVDGYLRG